MYGYIAEFVFWFSYQVKTELVPLVSACVGWRCCLYHVQQSAIGVRTVRAHWTNYTCRATPAENMAGQYSSAAQTLYELLWHLTVHNLPRRGITWDGV